MQLIRHSMGCLLYKSCCYCSKVIANRKSTSSEIMMGTSKLEVLFFFILSVLLWTTTASALIEDIYAPSRIFLGSLVSRTTSDLLLKADGNGICYSYAVQAADTCQSIAHAYDITVADIQSWNCPTYGWKGCDHMQQGDLICLSTGSPTMPVALPNATCGPQVPGTARPSNYTDLASLNPCPSDKCVRLMI